MERWPGYDKQSWAERFAELDRRYRDLQLSTINAIKQLSRPPIDRFGFFADPPETPHDPNQ